MKLSKREAKARMKLIQENNYDREHQQMLDQVAMEKHQSYSNLYRLHQNGDFMWYRVIVENMIIGRAVRAVGVAAHEFAREITRFATAYKEALDDESGSD